MLRLVDGIRDECLVHNGRRVDNVIKGCAQLICCCETSSVPKVVAWIPAPCIRYVLLPFVVYKHYIVRSFDCFEEDYAFELHFELESALLTAIEEAEEAEQPESMPLPWVDLFIDHMLHVVDAPDARPLPVLADWSTVAGALLGKGAFAEYVGRRFAVYVMKKSAAVLSGTAHADAVVKDWVWIMTAVSKLKVLPMDAVMVLRKMLRHNRRTRKSFLPAVFIAAITKHQLGYYKYWVQQNLHTFFQDFTHILAAHRTLYHLLIEVDDEIVSESAMPYQWQLCLTIHTMCNILAMALRTGSLVIEKVMVNTKLLDALVAHVHSRQYKWSCLPLTEASTHILQTTTLDIMFLCQDQGMVVRSLRDAFSVRTMLCWMKKHKDEDNLLALETELLAALQWTELRRTFVGVIVCCSLKK